MIVKPVQIFGFGASENAAVDDCLSAIQIDNDVFDRNAFSETSVYNVIASLRAQLETHDSNYASLAIIGLLEYAVKHQLPISDQLMIDFSKAKTLDPLSKYPERKVAITSLNNQLTSYLHEQGARNHVYIAN